MDDLVVIILTLIIAGVGVLGQLKKKKQAAGAEGEQPAPNNFWDLIQGEVGNNQQEEDLDYENSELEETQTSYIHEPEVVINKRSGNSFNSGNKEGVLLNEKVKKTKESKMKSRLKEDFSLRKAVIYSEILNRKYT